MDAPAVPALLIGAIFVEKGLITQEQLDVALEEQRATGERLGEILVARFSVSRLDLASALAEQWAEYEREGTAEQRETHAQVRDLVAVSDEWREPDALTPEKRPIGEIFVERGMVTEEELATALEEQRASGRRLGEILVSLGNLSRLDLASALADQWASFQKLRPPATAAADESQPARETIMPTTEVSSAPAQTSPPPELGVLNARLEVLESALATWKDVEHDVQALHSELAALAKVIEVATSSAPGEELRARVERLTDAVEAHGRRLGALPLQDGSLKDEVTALAAHVDELAAVAAGASAESAELPVEALRERVDDLAATVQAQALRVGELANREDEVAVVEQRLEELAVRMPERFDELRAALAELADRVEAIPAPSEEWREQVAALAARLEALPAADTWRSELGELSAVLRARLEQVEAELRGRPDDSAVAGLAARIDETMARLPAELGELRASLADVAAQVQAIPAPSEEWREQVAALAARLEALPAADTWRSELGELSAVLRARLEQVEAELRGRPDDSAVAGLAARIDETVARLPAELGELRASLADLEAQVEVLPRADAWRGELDRLAADLHLRLEQIEAREQDDAAAALRGELVALASRVDELAAPRLQEGDELHAAVRELALRVEAIPAPSEEWLGQVERTLGERLNAETLAAKEELAALSGVVEKRSEEADDRWRALVERLDRLSERLAAGEDAEHRLREAIAPMLEAAVADVRADGEELRGELDQVAVRLDAVEGLTGRVSQTERRLDAESAAVAGLAARLDELAGRLDAHDRGLEEHARRVDELDSRPSGADVDALSLRIDAAEGASTEVAARLDEHVAAAEASVAALTRRADEENDALKRKLKTLRESAVQRADVDRLAARIEEQAAGLDAARAELAAHEQRATETEAGQLAELADLRGRLEQAESALDAAAGWRDALESVSSSIGGLDSRHDQLAKHVDALERTLPGDDVRELREALARVERRAQSDEAQEDARTRAVEEALRDGLAALGARLTESQSAYLEAGDSLRRSVEGLGGAIRDADTQLSVLRDDRSPTARPTSFLAFVPTSEGYRLVECEGEPPETGGRLELAGCEDGLTVTRLGSSPLPFDRRPCAYLEAVVPSE